MSLMRASSVRTLRTRDLSHLRPIHPGSMLSDTHLMRLAEANTEGGGRLGISSPEDEVEGPAAATAPLRERRGCEGKRGPTSHFVDEHATNSKSCSVMGIPSLEMACHTSVTKLSQQPTLASKAEEVKNGDP